MLFEQLRDEWHVRKRAVQIYSVMTFAAFAEDIFRTSDAGREKIEIKIQPWPERP